MRCKAQQGNSDNKHVTGGIFSGGSQVNATATASGKGSKAMAGGVVSSRPIIRKNAKGVIGNGRFFECQNRCDRYGIRREKCVCGRKGDYTEGMIRK